MQTYLKNVYQDGKNDGDIIIKTLDGSLHCHGYVLVSCSTYFKSNFNDKFPDVIEFGYPFNVVNIVIKYLYTECSSEDLVSFEDIIKIFDFVELIKCSGTLNILLEYYANKFNTLITENNWDTLLMRVFCVKKYEKLQAFLLTYYNEIVLKNISQINLEHIKSIHKVLPENIKDVLFDICLHKFNTINKDISANVLPINPNTSNISKKVCKKTKKVHKNRDDNKSDNDSDSESDIESDSDNNSDNDSDDDSDNESDNDSDNDSDDDSDDDDSGSDSDDDDSDSDSDDDSNNTQIAIKKKSCEDCTNKKSQKKPPPRKCDKKVNAKNPWCIDI